MITVTDEMVEAAAEAYWREVYGRHRQSQKWPDDVYGRSEELFRAGCRKALEATALAVIGWQPIETAPCDWSDVVLFDPKYNYDERKVLIRYYDTNTQSWWCDYGSPVYPTHWQPLPAPPVTSESDA